MFDSILLSEEKKNKLLYLEENQYNDVKSKLITPAKLSQTVSAFANASGGDIYVGIKENTHSHEREYDGFSRVEDVNKYIQVLENLEGLTSDYTINFLRYTQELFCMQITVFKSNKIVKSSDGTIWVRRGAQNLKCESEEKIRKLEIDKGIFSYEDQIVQTSEISDAITSKVYNNFAERVIPNIDKMTWLKSQKMCFNNKLNISGVMLFTDEPQIMLPKRSAIKVYRYKTTGEGSREMMVGNPLSIEGCAYKQIYDAVAEVKKIIESLKTFDVVFNGIDYPEMTLHEIITNAVLHRDYSIVQDIQIRIFDNRVEVESPGKLAGHITVNNILTEQFARNPRIVRLINKFPDPPNKDVGEGLNTAFNEMKKLKLKPPQIIELDNSVVVIIRHEKLASPETIIMEYLEMHDVITNKIAREITGIESENSVKRYFLKLRDSGLIERVPGLKGNKAAWRKKEMFSEEVVECNEEEQLSFF